MSPSADGFKRLWERLPFAPDLYWRLVLRKSIDRRPRIRKLNREIAEWDDSAAVVRAHGLLEEVDA